MIKPGKKTTEWNKARAKLKIEYESKGITTCEARLPGCWYDNALGFAHLYKRDDPRCKHIFEQTLLLCNECHDKQEYDRELTERLFKKLR